MNNEIIIATTAVAGFVLAFISFTWQVITHIKEKKPIVYLELICNYKKLDDKYFITATTKIQNKGKKIFNIKAAQIYIDEPCRRDGFLDFPNLNSYEKGHVDCRLSEFCQSNSEICYPINLLPAPEDAAGCFKCFNLSFLAGQVRNIGEKEEFEETKVIDVPKEGFYRITSVVKPINAPCMCRSIIVAASK